MDFRRYPCFCLKLQTVSDRDSICIQVHITVNLQRLAKCFCSRTPVENRRPKRKILNVSCRCHHCHRISFFQLRNTGLFKAKVLEDGRKPAHSIYVADIPALACHIELRIPEPHSVVIASFFLNNIC